MHVLKDISLLVTCIVEKINVLQKCDCYRCETYIVERDGSQVSYPAALTMIRPQHDGGGVTEHRGFTEATDRYTTSYR